MLKTDLLKQYRPFNGLNEQLLVKVAENVTICRATKGDIIFKRGKVVFDLFFLLEGEVDLINNEFGIEKVKAGHARQMDALNQSSPTTVSAISKSTVTFFRVNAEWLEEFLHHLAQEDIPKIPTPEMTEGLSEIHVADVTDSHDWMSCILQSPVFSRIPMTQLQELFARFEKVSVANGDRVVKEGAKGDYFYVIAYGSCVVSNRSGSVNVELKAGDYFGEEALISQSPRNASVVMTSDGVLKRLNADDFLELVKTPVLRYIAAEELDALHKPIKILDVRMPIEFRGQHFPGSLNIPLSRLRTNLKELGHGTSYLISSAAGNRAEIAAYILCQAGFDALILNANDSGAPLSKVS